MSIVERLQAMLSAGNEGPQLRFGLASALFASGALPEALEHAQVAVELDPDYSAAWRLLGRIHLALGRTEDAVGAFERGIVVAERRGDRQLVKEMRVFLARATKAARRNDLQ
jgi:tetratricopeptide (TPR) repeat protein